MAYLDEQALEREISRQKLLEGKQPLLGDDTMAALQALGVSLGRPGSFTAPDLQLAPQGVKQTEATPLQAAPYIGPRPGPGAAQWRNDNSLGQTLQNILGGATGSALRDLLAQQQQAQRGAPVAPGGARLGDMARRGRTLTAPQGPQAQQPSPQQLIPGLRAPIDASKAMPGTPAAQAYMTEHAPVTAKGADATLAPGRDFSRVNPQFMQAIKEYSQIYHGQGGPYAVTFTSGYRGGPKEAEHGRGNAVDMQLVDKATGTPLPNYQVKDPKVFAAYQDYANGFHQYLEQKYPELAKDHRWGGYFSGPAGHYGAQDIMHHDLGGPRAGMLGGSWDKGLNPEQAKLYGLQPGGGLAGRPPASFATQPRDTGFGTQTTAPGVTAVERPATQAAARGGVPPELVDWVTKKESFTPNAFSDYGTTNIGYGTAARGRTSITEPQARAEMTAELGKHLATVDALNPNTPPAIRNMLASLAFNTGGKAIAGTGLADAVRAGNWAQAKDIFLQYNKVTDASGNKSVLPGLDSRRREEATAFDAPGKPAENGPAASAAAPTWLNKGTLGSYPATAAAQPAPQPAQPVPTPPPPAPAPPPSPPPPLVTRAPAPGSPPTGVAAAHKALDTKVIDLVKQLAPDQVDKIPGFIANQTLREAIKAPIIGGQISAGIPPYLSKLGIKPEDFKKAVSEPSPGPGKQSAAEERATDFSAQSRRPGPGEPLPPSGGFVDTVSRTQPPGPNATASNMSIQPGPMTPQLAQAIVGAVKAEEAQPGPPTPPEAQPVLPTDAAPSAPGAPGGPIPPGGGLGTLPAGNAPLQMVAASQGNPIALAGLSPIPPAAMAPPEVPPLSTNFNLWQPPIPAADLQGWGWSGE